MYRKIDPRAAKQRMAAEKNIILVDVRTNEEYRQCHVTGSMMIPHDEIEKMAKYLLPDKNATIFVGCSSGFRSRVSCLKLIDMGYTNVYDVGAICDLK